MTAASIAWEPMIHAETNAALGRTLLGVLRRHPEGLGEHALMKILAAEGLPLFRPPTGDMLALFRAHFLLFHVLYALRDRLRAEGSADLRIDCLRIALLPAQAASGRTAASLADPLRAYYLDLDNLRDTTSEEVAALLNGFWGRERAAGRRAEALRVLGLSEPVAYEDIKRRYRELAMRHHPDRGGEAGRLQEINAAMALLESGYR